MIELSPHRKKLSVSTSTKKLAKTFQVLGDPTRFAIFDMLMKGVQCNCEICDNLGIPMNLASHHLRTLRDAGLVNSKRDPNDARWIYYSVNEDAIRTLRKGLSAFFDPTRIQPRAPACGPRLNRVYE